MRHQHPDPARLCCDAMRAALAFPCERHDDPFDCPESVLAYHEGLDQFGLIIHNGAREVVVIRHCPWCASALGAHRTERSRARSALREVPAQKIEQTESP